MDRRDFLQTLAAAGTSAALPLQSASQTKPIAPRSPQAPPDVEGHALVCEFSRRGIAWKVYEDLRTRDGAITFVSANGARVLTKNAEPCFAEEGPPFLGLSIDEIGLSGRDLLAEKLLASGGDPDERQVRSAAPPQGSVAQPGEGRGRWTTFVGTKEAYDVTPVYPAGSTRTWLPAQYFAELRGPAGPPAPGATPAPQRKRYEGLVGGWMPATRTLIEISPGAYIENIVFGDVLAKDKFIVRTWHRSMRLEGTAATKVVYGSTYPEYPPARKAPAATSFYRALLEFAEYWDRQLQEFAEPSLPERSWVDLSKHCFAKEMMIRPGGVYPKYGGVDRDYFGSEYDGFQDVFTSGLYTNLEWGRFETARAYFDNYFSDFVDANGMPNMRGPETAQFGLTLSLLARYFNYTGDRALMLKHRPRIEATARVLADLQDIALALPAADPTRGLIRGWNESDACLNARPETWWQPYYANSAFAARGLKDIADAWQALGAGAAQVQAWTRRSTELREAVVASMRANIRHDLKPAYVPPMPGTTLPFREAMAAERPSPQQWPHRLYAELLHADVLPADLANLAIDTLRNYGGTTLGVVANIGPARPGARSILGFISYGYAQMLLRLDRIEEFLLFLYSHRYHDHTRGSWTAGEVSGIRGGTSLFCIPAQQTIPLLVRWMLVLEDSDEDRLYFGKGLPASWVMSGHPVAVSQAPTRFGRVDFNLVSKPPEKSMEATVKLARAGAPAEIQVKLRSGNGARLQRATVNGRHAALGGPQGDTVVIQTRGDERFAVTGYLP
ncbi:MAG: Tat pathway signal protein [Acidobacteria bacterium RIFCSPLOWO2_12_FULL_66_21]|nr:MAG: Tat pathway signal protein [Acidobacteria bacterium RIFCSPLOWO2_12_FULL_66_21]